MPAWSSSDHIAEKTLAGSPERPNLPANTLTANSWRQDMFRDRLKAIALWNDKQIWCPDIMLAWVIAVASVGSIVVLGPSLGA